MLWRLSLAGRGTSSYIDAVITRDKDANTAWAAASDATLEERRYYCQNWRADVVALLESDGDVSEWIRYSAYGEATVYPFVNGDFDADGDVDGDDTIAFSAAWDSNANAADVDRANGVDGDDVIAFAAAWDAGYASTAWTAGGGLPSNAGQLSVTSGNRIGYAGYQFDPATEQYLVRHRVYSPEMGRWTRRDPIGYVDGAHVYQYVSGFPGTMSDPSGLRSSDVSGRSGTIPSIVDYSLCPSGFHYDMIRRQCVRWLGPNFPFVPGMPDSLLKCGNDPVVAGLLQLVATKCGGGWRIQYVYDCGLKPSTVNCRTKTITICNAENSPTNYVPQYPDYFTTCVSLANELTHMLDFCTTGECANDGGFENACTLACSEIRSTYYDCCTRRPRGGFYNDDVPTCYDTKIGSYRRDIEPHLRGCSWAALEQRCLPASCAPVVLPP